MDATEPQDRPDRAGERTEGALDSERLLDEERQRNLRLLADFDNYRRRVAREQRMDRDETRRTTLRPLLPVLDTLERALAAGSSDPTFYEGVAAIHRLFLNALQEAGAEPIETVGRPFDPRLHDAIGTAPPDELEPGTVAQEVRRGWRLGDELLRPAQVIVTTAPETADRWR